MKRKSSNHIFKTCAIINIRMDFNCYYHGDNNRKIELIKQMIIKAVKKIKTKGNFDFE